MKFVLDTNIYLHYMLFTARDWKALLGSEDLTLVVPPTVIKELDEKKYTAPDTRLKRRAQEVISKFKEISEGKPLPGIQVDFPDSSIEEVDWVNLHLNSLNYDDRTIAATLALKEKSTGDEVLIVTADFGMKLKAKIHDIKVVSPPDDWKRETKDSRDKEIAELQAKLQKFENAMPDVQLRLSAGDELVKNLKISLDDPLKDIHSDEDIEKELDREREELKSIDEDIEKKLDREKEELKSIRAVHPILMHQIIPQSEIIRYDKEIGEYMDKYSKYLNDFKVVQELRSLTIKISPVLINEGSSPAEDIDILLKFPDDLELLKEADLPDFPEKPVRPKPPQSVLATIRGGFQIPPISSLISPILPHVVSESVNQIGPKINKSEMSLHYWLKNLKHGMKWRAEPVFVWNSSISEVHTFQIKYSINIGNHPEVKEGDLVVVIEDKK